MEQGVVILTNKQNPLLEITVIFGQISPVLAGGKTDDEGEEKSTRLMSVLNN